MALGPDGRIYLSRTTKPYLSAITNPNVAGTASNYVDSALYLGGKTNSWGLPNQIAGFKYSNATYLCPPSTGGIFEDSFTKPGVKVYPQPGRNNITIDCGNLQVVELFITDVTGRAVYQQKTVSGLFVLDCSAYPQDFIF